MLLLELPARRCLSSGAYSYVRKTMVLLLLKVAVQPLIHTYVIKIIPFGATRFLWLWHDVMMYCPNFFGERKYSINISQILQWILWKNQEIAYVNSATDSVDLPFNGECSRTIYF